MTTKDPWRHTRVIAAVVVVLATITACGSGDTPEVSTTTVLGDGSGGGGGGAGDNIDASPITQGIYVSLAADAPDGDVIRTQSHVLWEMATYPEIRRAVLAVLAAEPIPVLADVSGGPAGERVLVHGPLPDDLRRGVGKPCYPFHILFLEADGIVLVDVRPGVCGMDDTVLAFEFGADGVEIGDRRFIDGTPARSAAGTVAIDRPASRGYADGDTAEVVLEPVPEDEIALRTDGREWEPLRDFVCFDVTVRAGGGGSDGQVVPDVEIFQGGEPVPVPEPTDLFEPRVITQDAGTNVVWSFGPIDLDERQPDSITVTAAEGEIVSWDVSARHC
jgi:hypothetical protein